MATYRRWAHGWLDWQVGRRPKWQEQRILYAAPTNREILLWLVPLNRQLTELILFVEPSDVSDQA